jgi:Fe-S cluster biogenesis protein NfuA
MASISDIESLVKTEINPALKVHNGFIIIHDYDESLGVLKIAMGGGCQGCAGSSETL